MEDVAETTDRRAGFATAAVALGLLAYGGYCLLQSPSVRSEAASVPRMTCADLIRNGPGNHRYIALTDAWLDLERSVSERDGDTGALEMYHPLYPANLNARPAPLDLLLILGIMDEMQRRRIRDIRNERHRLGKAGLGELTGAVTSGAALPGWARKGFGIAYPGIPLAQCWVITIGQDEPTDMRADKLLQHGWIATLAGCGILLCWGVWRFMTKANRSSDDATPESNIEPALDNMRETE